MAPATANQKNNASALSFANYYQPHHTDHRTKAHCNTQRPTTACKLCNCNATNFDRTARIEATHGRRVGQHDGRAPASHRRGRGGGSAADRYARRGWRNAVHRRQLGLSGVAPAALRIVAALGAQPTPAACVDSAGDRAARVFPVDANYHSVALRCFEYWYVAPP